MPKRSLSVETVYKAVVHACSDYGGFATKAEIVRSHGQNTAFESFDYGLKELAQQNKLRYCKKEKLWRVVESNVMPRATANKAFNIAMRSTAC